MGLGDQGLPKKIRKEGGPGWVTLRKVLQEKIQMWRGKAGGEKEVYLML